MPTTDLPDPNSHLGTAGFKWHPEGSTDRPEQVHALQWPPHLVPGGGYETRRKKYRATAESFDGSNLERFTVGSGNERARMPLRFDSWAESLGDLLEDAADGVTVDFYPRLESTNLKFPVELVDVGDVTRVRDDSDRHGFGEFEVEAVWKDASTDDQGFWWMEGPNKLKNPRLARGTTDGVAERWTRNKAGSTSVFFDIFDRAQRIDLFQGTTSQIFPRVEQDVDGVVTGDVLECSVEARARRKSSTNVFARLNVEYRSAGSTFVDDTKVKVGSTTFTRVSLQTTKASTNVASARFKCEVRADSTGDRIRAWFRDAKLTIS